MQKKVWDAIRGHWRKSLLWLIFIGLVFVFISFRVDSLLPGATTGEWQYYQEVASGRQLVKDPSWLPHKLPAYITFKLSESITGIRLVSSVFATIFVVSSWYILNLVFSRRTAIMGTLLLLSSSWLLIVARSALPDSSYLLAIAAGAAGVWLLKKLDSWKIVPAIALLALPLIYIPGMAYILIGLAIYYRQHILAALKALTGRQRTLLSFTAFILLFPLILGAFFNPAILLKLFGLTTDLDVYKNIGNSIINNVQSLVWTSQTTNPFSLAGLPYLDIFSTVLLGIGLYRLRYAGKRVILLVLGFFSALMVLTGIAAIPFSALIPVIYAMVIYGVSFLLAQWYTVFPRNPVARAVGASLLMVSVLIIAFYHVVKLYVAWPHTPETSNTHYHVLIK